MQEENDIYDFLSATSKSDIWLNIDKIKFERTIWTSGKAEYTFNYDNKFVENFVVTDFSIEKSEEYDDWIYNELEKKIIEKIYIKVITARCKLYKQHKVLRKD